MYPTLDQLHQLGLAGHGAGLHRAGGKPDERRLSHAEWLGLLLDCDARERYERRLRARPDFNSAFKKNVTAIGYGRRFGC
jgi:hypothetical protein